MVIYKITNILTQKSYIGQTICAFEKRVREHKSVSSPTYISRAIRKYGPDNFSFDIIFVASSLEELNVQEVLHIEQHNTLYPNGYNLCTGGNNARPCSMARRKISAGNRGKNSYWYGKFGESHHSFGKKFNEEIRQKISKSRGGSSIKCVQSGEVFSSINDACRKLNLQQSCVSKVVSGQRPHTNGLTFERVEE